jgi:hypothetical protein
MYDLRLKTPFTYIASGASQSGKTSHVFNMLKCKSILFDVVPSNVIYYYNQWQPSFTEFQRLNIVNEWIGKLPTLDELQEKTLGFKEKNGSIVVIDDYMVQINQDISDLFTVLCHANNINVILLTQNIFSKNPFFRTVSLNATYIVILKNPRDASQITHFARQFAPQNSKYIIEAYRDVTRKAYSYLFFDHHQSTPELIRVRTDVLPHEAPMRVFTSKNCSI